MKQNHKEKQLPAELQKTSAADTSADAEQAAEYAAKQNNTIRAVGQLLFLPALLLVFLGGFMFFRTRGTRLLFISASKGLLYTRYWVFLLLGLLVILTAWVLIKRHPYQKIKKKKKQDNEIPQLKEAETTESSPSDDDKTTLSAEPEHVKSDGSDGVLIPEILYPSTSEQKPDSEKASGDAEPAAPVRTEHVCPSCGKPVQEKDKFCLNCGQKLK